MTKSVVSEGPRSLGAEGIFRRRKPSRPPIGAISLVASLFVFLPIHAGADDLQIPAQVESAKSSDTQGTLADEAPHITPIIEGAAAQGQPAPQTAASPAETQGTLGDDAPHITPIFEGTPAQGQPAPQTAASPADAQGTLADEAPHITPIAPGAPGIDTTQAPRE